METISKRSLEKCLCVETVLKKDLQKRVDDISRSNKRLRKRLFFHESWAKRKDQITFKSKVTCVRKKRNERMASFTRNNLDAVIDIVSE